MIFTGLMSMMIWLPIASLTINPARGALETSIGVLVALLAKILIASLFIYAIYKIIVTPMQRQARSELVLDLIDHALASGKPLQETFGVLTQIDQPGKPPRRPFIQDLVIVFGWPIRYLRMLFGKPRPASELEANQVAKHELPKGVRKRLAAITCADDLVDELKAWPYILPPDIAEILRAGFDCGAPETVLPYCRQAIRGDVRSQARATLAYHPLHVGAAIGMAGPMPAAFTGVLIISGLFIFIVPKFAVMFDEMLGGEPLPPLTTFIISQSGWINLLALGIMSIPGLLIMRYMFQRHSYFDVLGRGHIFDLLDRLTPWRRDRLQRTFLHTLGLMLDHGTPEPEALYQAGAATGSRRWQTRVNDGLEDLLAGQPLADVLRRLCPDRGVNWHWRQALHGPDPILPALAGWLEYLDARAFRSEQTCAHIVSTVLYLLYAGIVALVVVAMFAPLITLIDSL